MIEGVKMSTIEAARGTYQPFVTGNAPGRKRVRGHDIRWWSSDEVQPGGAHTVDHGSGTKKIITVAVAAFGLTAGLAVLAGDTAPVANACSQVANGAGGGWGNGGGVRESCLPNGDKYHCESVYVLGFGGENCFVIPKGDPRNP